MYIIFCKFHSSDENAIYQINSTYSYIKEQFKDELSDKIEIYWNENGSEPTILSNAKNADNFGVLRWNQVEMRFQNLLLCRNSIAPFDQSIFSITVTNQQRKNYFKNVQSMFILCRCRIFFWNAKIFLILIV